MTIIFRLLLFLFFAPCAVKSQSDSLQIKVMNLNSNKELTLEHKLTAINNTKSNNLLIKDNLIHKQVLTAYDMIQIEIANSTFHFKYDKTNLLNTDTYYLWINLDSTFNAEMNCNYYSDGIMQQFALGTTSSENTCYSIANSNEFDHYEQHLSWSGKIKNHPLRLYEKIDTL